MGRVGDHRTWTVDSRMDQAEIDLDKHDEQFELLWARNNKLLWVLIGLMISFTTGVVMLAANLVAGGISK